MGPDDWSKGWILHGGIVLWAGIFGDQLIGPYKVDNGVKLILNFWHLATSDHCFANSFIRMSYEPHFYVMCI